MQLLYNMFKRKYKDCKLSSEKIKVNSSKSVEFQTNLDYNEQG